MFPFPPLLPIDKGLEVTSAQVLKHIAPLLTKERSEKIDRVIDQRTFSTVVVLENIYDRGNASAVMRSAEALGFAQVHMIELGDKFKESQRVAAGADKWVEVRRWKSTLECVKELKAQGKQIIATHLDHTSKPIAEIDFSKPTALVLGNEKDGISKEMQELADERVIIPMHGFVQSYNISVAGALSLYHIYCDRILKLKKQGDLTQEQKDILKSVYSLRTMDSAKKILNELKQRNEL